jgi:hypothetical protein
LYTVRVLLRVVWVVSIILGACVNFPKNNEPHTDC